MTEWTSVKIPVSLAGVIDGLVKSGESASRAAFVVETAEQALKVRGLLEPRPECVLVTAEIHADFLRAIEAMSKVHGYEGVADFVRSALRREFDAATVSMDATAREEYREAFRSTVRPA